MGFLDKAKEQAEKLAKQGQDKLDDVQSKKRADSLLRDLGAWYYASRTDRDAGKGEVEMARIISELRAHEAEHGPLGGEDATATPPSTPPSTPGSAGPAVHAVPTAPPPPVGGVTPPPPPSTPPGPPSGGPPAAPAPAPPTAFPPPTAPSSAPPGGTAAEDL